MAIEVLLMSDVAGLGSEGAVVRVAEGYARNYLLPKKLAAAVTEGTRRRLAKMQKVREASRAADMDQARARVAQVEKISCTIVVKVGAEDKMYGSVTTADIADALKTQGVEVEKTQILLEKPIKELGVYDVKVKVHPEIEATMKVWIVQE